MFPKPGARVGPYQLLSHLGKGGMGSVYLAHDTRLERKVALKFLTEEAVLDEQRRRRFLREARTASALNHPHICTIYEVGETEHGHPYIAMEYIEGKTLQSRLAHSAMRADEVARVGSQVAEALAAAHSAGVIHRDIKPSNIMIDKRGWVKVLDFGLAKWTPSDPETQPEASTLLQTQEGRIMGTPTYMSPEQALGKTVDFRTDIFSLGVVLFEAVSGRLPFGGHTFGDVLENLIRTDPPSRCAWLGMLKLDNCWRVRRPETSPPKDSNGELPRRAHCRLEPLPSPPMS